IVDHACVRVSDDSFAMSDAGRREWHGSDRRLSPAAGLRLEIRRDAQADIFAPGFRNDLHADRQLAVRGAAAAHDDDGPARAVEDAGVRPAAARCAAAATATAAAVGVLVDRL